jgi:DNA helicase-2/ATP-dependent DNA helicase PcrA
MIGCMDYAKEIVKEDDVLKDYIKDRKADLELIAKDYNILLKVASKNKLNIKEPFKNSMIRVFADASGLSSKGRKNLSNKFFTDIIRKRENEGNPFTIEYIINRSTSVDCQFLTYFINLTAFGISEKCMLLHKAEKMKVQSVIWE